MRERTIVRQKNKAALTKKNQKTAFFKKREKEEKELEGGGLLGTDMGKIDRKRAKEGFVVREKNVTLFLHGHLLCGFAWMEADNKGGKD